MATAEYDQNESIDCWRRMAANSARKTPEFLSIHPVKQNRIEAIRNDLPSEMEYCVSK